MDIVKSPFLSLRTGINNSLSAVEPWKIVSLTATSVLATVWLYEFVLEGDEGTRLHCHLLCLQTNGFLYVLFL